MIKLKKIKSLSNIEKLNKQLEGYLNISLEYE